MTIEQILNLPVELSDAELEKHLAKYFPHTRVESSNSIDDALGLNDDLPAAPKMKLKVPTKPTNPQ